MNKHYFLTLCLFWASLSLADFAHAQVGIGTTTPDASAQLEIVSDKKGLLIPRMDQAAKNAIVSPATGLMIFQTDIDPGFYYYSGTAWEKLAPPAPLPSTSFTANASTAPSPFPFPMPDGPLIANWNVLSAGSNGIFNPGTSSFVVAASGIYKFTARVNYSVFPTPVFILPDNDPAFMIRNTVTLEEYARGVIPTLYSGTNKQMPNSGTVIVEGTASLNAGDQIELYYLADGAMLFITFGNSALHPNGINWTISKID